MFLAYDSLHIHKLLLLNNIATIRILIALFDLPSSSPTSLLLQPADDALRVRVQALEATLQQVSHPHGAVDLAGSAVKGLPGTSLPCRNCSLMQQVDQKNRSRSWGLGLQKGVDLGGWGRGLGLIEYTYTYLYMDMFFEYKLCCA